MKVGTFFFVLYFWFFDILGCISGCGKVGNPSALGAEDRRFEFCHSDHVGRYMVLSPCPLHLYQPKQHQLVEQLPCKHQVVGSSPSFGSVGVQCWFYGQNVALAYVGSIPIVHPYLGEQLSWLESETDNFVVADSSSALPTTIFFRGFSSVGRASALQAEGRGIVLHNLHKRK